MGTQAGAVQGGSQAGLLTLAPLGKGNNPVQLPWELGLVGHPITVLTLKDKATNCGLKAVSAPGEIYANLQQFLAFPGGPSSKEPPCNAGDRRDAG